MERRFKKNGGITLIALIITIIIMLILVAVSVNILIKSNLIGAAEKTAKGYKTAYEKENNGYITINGEKYSSLDEYAQNINSNLKMSYKIQGEYILVTIQYIGNIPTDEEYIELMKKKLEDKNVEDKKKMLLDVVNLMQEINNQPTYKDLDELFAVASWESFVQEVGGGDVDTAIINIFGEIFYELVITLPDGTKEISADGKIRYLITEPGEYEFKAEALGEENSRKILVEKTIAKIKAGERASETSKYQTAVIPKGFTVSGISTEQNVANGLVIYDIPEEDLKDSTKVDWANPDTVKTKYNQFVWIPVEVTSEDTEESVAAFARSNWTDSTDGGQRTNTIYDAYTEPYSYDDADYDGTGEGKTGIASQIAELTKSIYNYGGFWIGRYEAGVKPEADGTEPPRTSSSSSQTAEFVIQQDKYPYNYIKWGTSMGNVSTEGAVHLCNNLYTDYETYGVKSMLCTGAAWDSMLDFIKDSSHSVKDSTTWGNYETSDTYQITRGKLSTDDGSTWTAANPAGSDVTKNESILLTTGATDRNSWRNLYDVAGNCWEWTTEANIDRLRFLRGGCYANPGSSYSASNRNFSNTPTKCFGFYSFRPLLYINVN